MSVQKDLNSLFTGRYASSCMNITPSFLSVACRLMMTMIISFALVRDGLRTLNLIFIKNRVFYEEIMRREHERGRQ